MIYFYFQGEYCLFKHYLFHVYACRFVPSVEFYTKYSIYSLSPVLQSHSGHNRKWAPSDICCLCPLFLLLMIALSLITLTTDCSISLTKWVVHTTHMSCVRDNYFPIAHSEKSVSSLQIAAGQVSPWLEKKANISMMWDNISHFLYAAYACSMQQK